MKTRGLPSGRKRAPKNTWHSTFKHCENVSLCVTGGNKDKGRLEMTYRLVRGMGIFQEKGKSRSISPGGGHSSPLSILAWRIPWTEESGGLQFMGLQRVRHE